MSRKTASKLYDMSKAEELRDFALDTVEPSYVAIEEIVRLADLVRIGTFEGDPAKCIQIVTSIVAGYTQALATQWGVIDPDDKMDDAEYLATVAYAAMEGEQEEDDR